MSVARSYYNANVRRGTIVDMETETVKKRETMVEIEDKLREGAFQDELRAARSRSPCHGQCVPVPANARFASPHASGRR